MLDLIEKIYLKSTSFHDFITKTLLFLIKPFSMKWQTNGGTTVMATGRPRLWFLVFFVGKIGLFIAFWGAFTGFHRFELKLLGVQLTYRGLNPQ